MEQDYTFRPDRNLNGSEDDLIGVSKKVADEHEKLTSQTSFLCIPRERDLSIKARKIPVLKDSELSIRKNERFAQKYNY